MRKKRMWLQGLGLLLSMSLLAGCGGGGAKAPSGAQGNEILVGANFELSGPVATYGQSTYNATVLAFDEINAKGGVLGKPIKLIKYDNKSDKTESANVATKLITQDRVSVLVGPVTSGSTLSVIPVATQHKVPVVTPTATSPDVTVDPNTKKVNDYLFRACFLDSFQGRAAAEFAMKKGQKAAILISQSDEYSKGLGKYFGETFKAKGGTIVAEEAFNPDDNDYMAILTKVRAENPDVIYLPAYYEAVGKIVKQARGLGITVPFIGSDGWDSPKLAEVAGVENLSNCFFTNHYTPQDPDPAVQAFVKAYQAKFEGQTPDALAALAYDGARLVADAITRAGSTEPEAIKQALAATKDFPAVTGKFSLNETHDPIKAIVVIELKDGKQIVAEKLTGL
ncbi:ABC transporter substrate-binding protein [Heliophilum fasciatum]|uniref:Amino acid/amide ABC transporter substrate-binding protein (HAAT family) n=1 Tax=Heliophilum fasciatum TaxID=35700 RepID=A0A4R2RLE6_9FIRM|nr:ABC transporter substrate-binding protein [Heliophilum fasciatum]MCW2278364.1 branched-chain amino acid transport system substrate-binding protein [Heliophilum fasciatum]TCP63764.1 amino acid/amide ABC transporter substrate-binding protein (HAAT family) [Heliophilum fasciatum]